MAKNGNCRPVHGIVATLGEWLVRPWVYFLFHSWRLFGYFWILPAAFYFKPVGASVTVMVYAAIHRQKWWQRAVHRFFGYGASHRHKIVNHQKHLIKDDKRYLWCLHPHSVLADGWHSIIAKNIDSFETGLPHIGRKIALCFAPIIHHVPIHQEMYRDMSSNATKKTVMKWLNETDIDPALIPGGFPESVFANANDDKYEYSFIKDRMGFIRLAIEAGIDIIPVYTFRSTRMYFNPGYLRGWRARYSQRYRIGLVPFVGKWGTSMPLTDKTTTVVFPPFEASRYSLEHLDDAHQAYMAHLKKYFDEYKVDYGMRNYELVFVGSDWVDDDILSRMLTKLGVLKSPVRSKL